MRTGDFPIRSWFATLSLDVSYSLNSSFLKETILSRNASYSNFALSGSSTGNSFLILHCLNLLTKHFNRRFLYQKYVIWNKYDRHLTSWEVSWLRYWSFWSTNKTINNLNSSLILPFEVSFSIWVMSASVAVENLTDSMGKWMSRLLTLMVTNLNGMHESYRTFLKMLSQTFLTFS